MIRTLSSALVAVALVGGSLAVAQADEVTTSKTTTTTTGPVFGYEDGYWARDHVWHTWASPADRTEFQKTESKHFYSSTHTTAPDEGWREHDEYWETH